MGTLFVVLPINVRRGSTKEISLLAAFLPTTTTLIKHCTPLSQVSRLSKVYQEFEAKIMEIKVAIINFPLY